jgi:(p)ppGpp synthase/HD superfamily hydrolase
VIDGRFTPADAIALAERAHAGQTDKVGEPYIEHVRRVVAAVANHGDDAQMAAALHDVVEDTAWTLEQLAGLGIPRPVLDAVDALTARPGEAYEAMVRRAAADPLARVVKLADNLDNADEGRLVRLDQGTAERLRAKYAMARALLTG